MSEKIKELVKIFKVHGISHDSKKKTGGLQDVLKFQDLIGHSTMDQLYELVEKMDSEERRFFMWSCLNCLDYDTVMNIFVKTIASLKLNSLIEPALADIDKQENDLFFKERVFNESKKTYWKRLNKVKRENEKLAREKEALQQSVKEYNERVKALVLENKALKMESENFNMIKKLLQ